MSEYLDFLDQMADRYGVPREEARAIYENETRSGRIVRNSPAGAIGHMQLMPGTARELGVNPMDPRQNIEGGVRYYAQQRKRFGDPALAAAAYNAGPGRVGKLGRVPNIPETRDYVSRFLTQIGRVKPSPQAAASANVPPEQGTTPMDTPAGGLSAATAADQTPSTRDRLRAADEELMGLYEGLPALRKQQFESGQQRINEMYAGPSLSSQLFALSRALLAPRKFKGFAGTMQNVSNALGQIGEQREMAQMKRAEALARLQESYQTGEFEGKMDILKARRDALRAEVDAEQAAAKAGQPSYQLDQAGNIREVPKQVFKPTSRAEYDAIPAGAYYVVPAGPQAGQVVRKTATGQ